MYIIVEGGDGSGKDTQADFLTYKLKSKNKNVLKVAEPYEGFEIGQLLRSYLKSGKYQEAHAGYFFTDRLMLQNYVIAPELVEGHTVISVRSFISTLVYQQDNWSLSWLLKLNALLPLRPDVIIFIDTSAEECWRRISARNRFLEVYEADQEKVARNNERYKNILSKPGLLTGLVKSTTRIIRVPGDGTPYDVSMEMLARLQSQGVSLV